MAVRRDGDDVAAAQSQPTAGSQPSDRRVVVGGYVPDRGAVPGRALGHEPALLHRCQCGERTVERDA
jgi:hypothetical protein